MLMHEKCRDCAVMDEIEKSEVPCVCAWYLDNVVIAGKTVDECDDYKRRG